MECPTGTDYSVGRLTCNTVPLSPWGLDCFPAAVDEDDDNFGGRFACDDFGDGAFDGAVLVRAAFSRSNCLNCARFHCNSFILA